MNLYYCKLGDNKNIIEYGTINQLYKPVSKTNILKYGHIDNWTTVMSEKIMCYLIIDMDFDFDENSKYKDKINILHDLKSRIRQDKLELLLR